MMSVFFHFQHTLNMFFNNCKAKSHGFFQISSTKKFHFIFFKEDFFFFTQPVT